MSPWLALLLLAAQETVLVAPASAPFVGVVDDGKGGAVVARKDGVIVYVDADGVVVDEGCAGCASVRLRRLGGDRRLPTLRLEQGFSLARRGENPALTQNAWDLFVFPYGTTGEPYLEFAPDSPAFWGVVRGAKNTTFALVDEPGPTHGRVAQRGPASAKDDSAPPTGPGSAGAFAISSAMVGDELLRSRLWRTVGDDNDSEDDDRDDRDDDDRCRTAPTMGATLHEVMASDRVSARLLRATQPSLWWRVLPVVDVAAGSVHVDAVADVIAVFRDGVEHSAPAGFVRRTLQGHVENDDAAALARKRATDMPYGLVSLRFDLDRLVGEPADVRTVERAWRPIADRRLTRAAALVDEHQRLCARPTTVSSVLRRDAIADELAIVSPSWRAHAHPTSVSLLEDR
jgi:hypothetical protein